jgi:linoleoyl-CoA desaturase
MIESPLAQLTDEVFAELGERDRRYITRLIRIHRELAVLGRVFLFGARYKPAWVLGTATLSVAKVLENMEIGHNVMHGQWNWMHDPYIHSSSWDWDSASTPAAWKHSHNYVHHTYTNIRGKDKDLGYKIMRIDPHQRWRPVYLLQPGLQRGADGLLRVGRRVPRPRPRRDPQGREGDRRAQDRAAGDRAQGGASDRQGLRRVSAAVRPQGVQEHPRGELHREHPAQRLGTLDHLLRPLPDQTYTFSEAEVADENRGRFYVRQLLGAANIEGSPLFHILSGNLGYQVEHHLYPDMPSTRYSEPRSSVEVTRPGELWEPRSASRLCCSGPLTAPANRLSDEEPSPTEPRNAVAGVPAREGR